MFPSVTMYQYRMISFIEDGRECSDDRGIRDNDEGFFIPRYGKLKELDSCRVEKGEVFRRIGFLYQSQDGFEAEFAEIRKVFLLWEGRAEEVVGYHAKVDGRGVEELREGVGNWYLVNDAIF